MSERHITLIGEHEVKISILNQLVEHSGNEEISSLEDCFISKFGHTIQDLLKPTRSVKFSVIVNPNYEFYKQLSDRFTDKAYYPDGLSELFARRKKCMQERKTVSIDNFNNNSDDSNKTIRKTDKSKRSFSNYRTEPKEDSQDSNEKLDRECEDHLLNDTTWTDSRHSLTNQDRPFTISSPENQIQIQPYATFLISPSKRVHSTSDNETILSPGKYGDVRETAANDVRRLITAKRRARKGEEFLSWIFIPLDVPVKAVDRRPLKASRSSHGQPKSKRVRFSETIESDATENAPLPPLPPPEDVPHPPPPPLDVADIDETSLVRGVTDCPVETVPQEGRDENFISSNMDENQDNFNPEWSEVANIYNTQRYDLIQRRWDTNDVANPKRNLTIVQYKTRSRHRRRTEPIVLYDRSSGNDEDEPLPKRSRMESCTYMFDKLIEEVNNRIERVKLKFATRKREALAMLKRTQLRQLENRPNKYLSMQQHRQELRRFNVDSALRLQNILNPFKSRVQKLNALREDLIHFYNFYRGLSKANELALHLTPEEAEDILSIEATISGYRDCYGDAR
uniref:Uncharacterized protein n=1 Tax=Cacopsylla melanoneura TaxID=428564 RepID=A0A8D9AQP8_9HEMI